MTERSSRYSRYPRRRVLRLGGTAALAALGGCAGGRAEGTPPEQGTYGDWFAGVDSFDGTREWTGRDEVRVFVGGDDGWSFDPAAIRVSTGTTVVWEWSGTGSSHNVMHVDGEFESEYSARKGHTFSHAFESPGVYKYVCVPHRGMGMKGAVHVVDP
jgi:halocyanin-like protein